MRAEYRVLGPLEVLLGGEPALGDVRSEWLTALERRGEAVASWQRAIGLWRDLGDHRAEQLAGRLAALEQPGRQRPPR